MASWAPGGDTGKASNWMPGQRALAKWDSNHDGKLSKQESTIGKCSSAFPNGPDQDGLLNPNRNGSATRRVFSRAAKRVLAIKPTGRGELPKAPFCGNIIGASLCGHTRVDHGILWMVKDAGIVTKLRCRTGRPPAGGARSRRRELLCFTDSGRRQVYFASESGTMTVVAGDRIGASFPRASFMKKIFATPAMARGKLYVRTSRPLTASRKRGLRGNAK